MSIDQNTEPAPSPWPAVIERVVDSVVFAVVLIAAFWLTRR